MSKRALTSVGPWAVFLFYLAIALEVIIMVTPFTAYFYTVYAPVLGTLEASPATAWLTAFFLPHISVGGDPLLGALAVLGPVLLGIGLVIFGVCASRVYWSKIFKKGVVSGGLYSRVRHPQYLGLAIAGLGLLLYWPRFIILVLYVVMLFLYYLLARDEERRMTRKHGESYRQYAESLPMFVPGGPGERMARVLFRGKVPGVVGVFTLFVVTLVGSVGLAAALRAYSMDGLTTVRTANIVGISLTGGTEEALRGRIATALDEPQVRERVSEHPETHTLVAYVLPQEYMMQHLIADLGEHESHHGGGEAPGFLAAVGHLLQMYTLKPRRQLRAGAGSPLQRVIFTMAERAGGGPVPPTQALNADVLRRPLFFSDLDGGRVAMTMDTPPRHTWGTIPVPGF